MQPVRIELPTPFADSSVNAYLFIQPEVVLVDTGVDSDESWQLLEAGLAAHNLKISDIKRVIITHAHIDHFGAAARITEHSEAQIWIADIGYDWLVNPAQKWQERIDYYQTDFLPQTGMPENAQQMVKAFMAFSAQNTSPVAAERVMAFKVGEHLEMGGLAWDVLHMPGHASHQTCFYQPDTRQFISADMLLHRAPTPIVENPANGRERTPALPVFLQSLERVEALKLEVVYPGHGDLITEPYPLMQKQRERIHRRKDETLKLVKEAHPTIFELVNLMYAHYPENARIAGLWMLVGYLDLLLEEEAVDMKEVDGVWHYFASL